MIEQLPTYLVQTKDGVLHAYWRKDILRVDLAVNRNDPPPAIYKLGREKLAVRYKRVIGRISK